MDEALADALEGGATLITATRRLARFNAQEYARHRQHQGQDVWVTPDILPWSTWLARCWDEMCESSGAETNRQLIRLSDAQAQTLWESVIKSSPEGGGLLQIAAAANSAAEAWRLIQAYRIPLWDKTASSPDVQAFRTWVELFLERCEAGDWLDAARLPNAIAHTLRRGKVSAPSVLIHAGFDELTPQQRELLTVLEDAGCEIKRLEPLHEEPPPEEPQPDRPLLDEPGLDEASACQNSQLSRCGLTDRMAEITAAARWARHCLERTPEATIGVVVPNLDALRSTIVRVFTEYVCPQALYDPVESLPRPFNLSLGRPLRLYPLVQAALNLLHLLQGRLTLTQIGGLLRSPYLRDADQEQGPRALLDARLRELDALELSVSGLRALAQRQRGVAACPRMVALLEQCHKVAQGLSSQRLKQPPKRQPSAWAATFTEWLSAAGWPGDRRLNSEEYQTYQAWIQLLRDFAAQELVSPAIDRASALDRLCRLATETLFQPESPEVPIQIMGLLETAGLSFDHLWIMGLSDDLWPPTPHPNPFIPVGLQREFGLPQATAEGQLTQARRHLERLLCSAPSIVLSHPLREGDSDLRPSALISGYRNTDPTQPPGLDWLAPRESLHRSARLEHLADTQGPPLSPGSAANGGTQIFRLQAACPFQAFARFRLGAVGLQEPRPGFDPAERGQSVHAVLAQLWLEIKDQATLITLSEEALGDCLRQAVEKVVAERSNHKREVYSPQLTQIEKARLNVVVRQWLELEKRRPSFQIEACEEKRSASIGPLNFTLVVDRIDQLASGEQIILDYKTGKPRVGAWFDLRPDEPQLPIYALVSDAETAGLAFAQVRAGEPAFKGITRDPMSIPGVKALGDSRYGRQFETWRALVNHWRQVLEGLADEFAAGKADVDPKVFPTTCEYCDFASLCRIHELRGAASEGAEHKDHD